MTPALFGDDDNDNDNDNDRKSVERSEMMSDVRHTSEG